MGLEVSLTSERGFGFGDGFGGGFGFGYGDGYGNGDGHGYGYGFGHGFGHGYGDGDGDGDGDGGRTPQSSTMVGGHKAFFMDPSDIRIGCQRHSVEEWERIGDVLAIEEDVNKREVEYAKEWIDRCMT